ncbi:MAG: glutamate--tRNA ligase [Patescibacteria group bacterium]
MVKKNRLRFAPSPTGFLHVGNLRTALFGYLLSKSLEGDFILRLEDTDQKREVTGALESLINIMDWIGIKFSEGPHLGGDFGPYIQTERLGIYHDLSEQLINEGKAYRCFCTSERLDAMRENQQAQKLAPRYDRACRDLSPEESEIKMIAGEKFVIRQKMPLDGEIKVFDELRGEIIFSAADLDDHVLIKSDGVPTYQFANIVDDHLMEITHVTRGDEWIPSFPKNILLYQAFDWTAPKFFHLPLILNKGGGKLSKRQGDVFVEDYRAKGYLPEAIINFCVLLGWHPKSDQEFFTLNELEKEFSAAGMGVSPSVFDLEKMDFYNSYYIRQKSDQELLELCRKYLPSNLKDEFLLGVVALAKDRMKKISDITELSNFFFELPNYEASLLAWKTLSVQDSINNLKEINQILEENNIIWTKEGLEELVFSWLKKNNKKNGDYLWPLRVALSGEKNSPSPFEIASVLGREECFRRLKISFTKFYKSGIIIS